MDLTARNRQPVMLAWRGLGLTPQEKNPNLRQGAKRKVEPQV